MNKSEWEMGWDFAFRIRRYNSLRWLGHNVQKFQEGSEKLCLMALGKAPGNILGKEKDLASGLRTISCWRRSFRHQEVCHSPGHFPLNPHWYPHSSECRMAKGPAYSCARRPSKLFLAFLMQALWACHGSGLFHKTTCCLAVAFTGVS